jgi:hypothetical protein
MIASMFAARGSQGILECQILSKNEHRTTACSAVEIGPTAEPSTPPSVLRHMLWQHQYEIQCMDMMCDSTSQTEDVYCFRYTREKRGCQKGIPSDHTQGPRFAAINIVNPNSTPRVQNPVQN